MKDRIYTILAFAGFIVILAVYLINVPQDRLSKVFYNTEYYTPVDEVSSRENSASVYNQMVGGRVAKCPSVEIGMSDCNGISLSGIYDDTNNVYDNHYFFLTYEALGFTNNFYDIDDGWINQLGLSQCDVNTDITLSQLSSAIGDSPVEIIAPFKFTFVNNNTDSGNENEVIIIQNANNNIRIEFANCSNWFCAGEPGTRSEVLSGMGESSLSWEEHKENHNSIIGSSGNSIITGGRVGGVIGYGNGDTIVRVYKYMDGEWVRVSISDWINP